MIRYVAYGLYAGAALLLIYGFTLHNRLRRSELFGVIGMGTVTDCKCFGVGMIKKYNAEIRYKARGKKYTGHIITGFEQPLKKRMEVQIRYDEENPKDVIARGNELYKIVWTMAAAAVVLAGLLLMIGEKL